MKPLKDIVYGKIHDNNMVELLDEDHTTLFYGTEIEKEKFIKDYYTKMIQQAVNAFNNSNKRAE